MVDRGWGQLLADKVAIVTGGAGSIGGACVRVMADHGARVLVADVPGSSPEAVAGAIREGGGEARPFEGDVSSADDVDAMVSAANDAWGNVDVLVNVAALTGPALADDRDVVTMTLASWDRVFAVNLRGAMLCSRRVIPQMVESGAGSIVNISSGAAIRANPYLCAYSATKAGLNSLTAHIATAFGKQGVRCNAIMPGVVLREKAMAPQGFGVDLEHGAVKHVLTPRLGQPDDIANLVTFLASDVVSGYITGQVISCDGGFAVHSPMYGDEQSAAR
jgi:NAD(P)-dependent dehydrogenase (short-subunit alcohol dehydrogenase family)